MAENGQDNSDQLKNIAGSRPSSATKEDTKARLKSLKERENDERQKKLEELKAQALAAQRFKERKEMERRQRIDELRHKEDSRRQQVEERKRAINDAERDRLESILKRNQEREARIEAKRRNERHSLVFAFGSSTPRMLEPTDSIGSFWGHRKATSTQNIPCTTTPLTRRQSERELDGGSKKRATSAGGLERSVEGTPSQVPAGCASGYVGRRRTDLMPTIPSRDSTSTPARKSFARSPGRAYSMSRLDQLAKPRKRPSELPSLAETTNPPSFRPLNRPQQSSVSRSMSHLAVSKVGQQPPQRPLRKSDSRSMHQLSAATPLPVPRTTRATQLRQQKLATTYHEAPSRPSSSLSQQSTSSITSSVTMRTQPIAAPRRPRPISIAVTGISTNIRNGLTDSKKTESKPPLPKTRKSSLVRSTERLKKKSITSPTEGSPKLLVSPTTTSNVVTTTTTITTHSPIENTTVVKEITQTVTKEVKTSESTEQQTIESTGQITVVSNTESTNADVKKATEQTISTPTGNSEVSVAVRQEPVSEPAVEKNVDTVAEEKLIEEEVTKVPLVEKSSKGTTEIQDQPVLDTSKITDKTVETFKVDEKLVETFKIDDKVVETTMKLIDLSIQPTESHKENVLEASTKLEEKVPEERVPEIESLSSNAEDLNDPTADMTMSMIKIRINTEEEAKAALAERRRIAREEAEKQAELERRRIEEEARLELERQQREEEQQRILIEQMRAAEQERLEEAIKEAKKREEEERLRREEENRMKLLKEEAERKAREEAERQKAELQERLKNEEKEREARRKRVEAIMLRTRGKNNSSTTPQTEEKNEENKPENLNGSKVDASENGHKNGKEIETVDNIIPVDSLKNANTVNNVDNLSTDDTLNSNNSWQHNTQTDLLM